MGTSNERERIAVEQAHDMLAHQRGVADKKRNGGPQ